MEGRVIHSQYLQTLADSGYPGLILYLAALLATWWAMARGRRTLKRSEASDAALARSMLNGVEGALFVFCFGASFLSLEVFELPYIMALLGIQIALLVRHRATPKKQGAPAPVALLGNINVPALSPRPS
jgi:O-antigen ligase